MLEQTQYLGKLESVHSISPEFTRRTIIVAAVSFICFLVPLIGFYIGRSIGNFLLSAVSLIIFVLTLFRWLMRRRDVLALYENGFVFKNHVCLWDEVEILQGKMESRLIGGAKLNFEVTKMNGERIVLTEAIADADRIIERISEEIEKRSTDSASEDIAENEN